MDDKSFYLYFLKSRGLLGISFFFKELPLGKDLNNLNFKKKNIYVLKANMFFPSTRRCVNRIYKIK